MKYRIHHILPFALCAVLSACGGGTSSGSDTGDSAPEPTSTNFSLSISDAPVDQAQEVWVYFDKVTLAGDNSQTTIDVKDDNGDPLKVDLLTLQHGNVKTLISNKDIPLGTYDQLKVHVTESSYIVMDGGTFPLKVPSNELKLGGFTALPNVEAAYTLEFDLRKSLVDPVGQSLIFLKPRGVRLVANSDVGTLEGTVDASLLEASQCAVKTDMNTGNAVYIYSGQGYDLANLGDDADSPVNTDEVSPLTTAAVTFDQASNSYHYQAGYLPAGDYTVAFTCLAQADLPESDEGPEQGFELMQAKETSVSAGNGSQVNFP